MESNEGCKILKLLGFDENLKGENSLASLTPSESGDFWDTEKRREKLGTHLTDANLHEKDAFQRF